MSGNKRTGFASNDSLREQYKPIIAEIKKIVTGNTIRLYRSKDSRYADKDITSWSLKREIAESFSQGRKERIYDPAESEILVKDIPTENILAISNTLYDPEFMGKNSNEQSQSQYEFIIENADYAGTPLVVMESENEYKYDRSGNLIGDGGWHVD